MNGLPALPIGQHRSADPTDLPCPVCRVVSGRACLGIDFLPLPSVHGERTAATPLFDELLAAGSVGAA